MKINNKDIVDILDEMGATFYYNYNITDSVVSEAARTIRNLRETLEGVIEENTALRKELNNLNYSGHHKITTSQREAN